jgi:hypothetical protein
MRPSASSPPRASYADKCVGSAQPPSCASSTSSSARRVASSQRARRLLLLLRAAGPLPCADASWLPVVGLGRFVFEQRGMLFLHVLSPSMQTASVFCILYRKLFQ